MRLFAHGCGRSQLPYTANAEELSASQRLDLEMHAVACPDCASELRDIHAIDVALRRAFAPMREHRALVAPGRVRLAIRSAHVERATWFRIPAFFGRLAEVSVMVGVTIFAVGGSLEQPRSAAPEQRSVIQDYFRAQPPSDELSIEYFRWLRVQPAPEESRDLVRLPAGGRFDVEQIETVKPSSLPR